MGTHTRREALILVVLFLLMSEIAQLCLCDNSNIGCIEGERQALLKFRASFNNPSQGLLSTWEGNDCCKWKGVGCHNVTGHVISLNLSNPYAIPDYEDCYNSFPLEAQNVDPSILQLKHLTYLDLSGNYFNANPIPKFLGSMTQLTYLSLSCVDFTGKIPHSLGNLTNLRYLDLSYNEIYRNDRVVYLYADEINWISQLSSLQYLGMSEVDLGKAHNLFQVLNLLPSLLQIHLGYCELSSSSFLHHPINLTNLTKIEVLDLSSNALQAPFLDAFQNMTSVSVLRLSDNNLDSLPLWLGKFNNLVELYFQGNILDGQFPLALQNLTSIRVLDLSSNNLSTMPYLQMKYLYGLHIANNHIKGQLPENIGNVMPGLGQLFLGNNRINGSIPNSLCKIEYLVNLDLSENKLSGEIPDCWRYNNQLLEEMNLSCNNLSGHIPSSFGNLSSLSWLNLNNNKLQGKIPFSIKNLKKLVILDLGDNQLSDVIPSWTGNMFPILQILRLRQNNLSGTIPSQLCQLSALKILDVSGNNLVGSIPSCIGNLLGMRQKKSSYKASRVFDQKNLQGNDSVEEPPLNDNESVKQVIKGREFEYTKTLKLLVNMDLSHNNLVGLIPEGITLLTGLHGLHLSDNNLSGMIPRYIRNMESLESFDVSYNELSGEIPNTMSTLLFLSYLNLSYNNFSGPIPTKNQFLVLDYPYNYIGNPLLCGSSLPIKCTGDGSNQVPGNKGYKEEDGKTNDLEKMLFYFVILVGFTTGFWGVIGVLLIKKRWRYACSRWVDNAVDNLYVAIFVKLARLKRKMLRNNI